MELRHCHMMTSSNGNIFRVTGHLCAEFTGHRWITRTKASDVELWCFFDLRLNERLSRQWWGWCFKTPPRPWWRHCNEPLKNDSHSRRFVYQWLNMWATVKELFYIWRAGSLDCLQKCQFEGCVLILGDFMHYSKIEDRYFAIVYQRIPTRFYADTGSVGPLNVICENAFISIGLVVVISSDGKRKHVWKWVTWFVFSIFDTDLM